METIRVAYAGHDFFASCLPVLTSHPVTELVLCMTEGAGGLPASNVIRMAENAGATIVTGRPDRRYVDTFNAHEIDLLVCAAYMYKIPVDDLAVRWAVNVHPALLPEGRGGNPLPYLVDGHGGAAGVSLHRMTMEFDRGPILLQRRIAVTESDGVDELYLKLLAVAPQALSALLGDLEGYFAAERPNERGSWWPEPDEAVRTLDAATATVAAAREAARKYGLFGVNVRLRDGTLLRTRNLRAAQADHDYPPGAHVLDLTPGTVLAVADGLIMIDSHL